MPGAVPGAGNAVRRAAPLSVRLGLPQRDAHTETAGCVVTALLEMVWEHRRKRSNKKLRCVKWGKSSLKAFKKHEKERACGGKESVNMKIIRGRAVEGRGR